MTTVFVTGNTQSVFLKEIQSPSICDADILESTP